VFHPVHPQILLHEQINRVKHKSYGAYVSTAPLIKQNLLSQSGRFASAFNTKSSNFDL
jgi:hypothetical protein